MIPTPSLTRVPLLAIHDIHKRFPGVYALRGISLEAYPGEVHALVGENGAGKSTLMHILAGVYQPDGGTIQFEGRDGVVLPDEHAAQMLGIAIVFQERSLFSQLNVAENIFAGRQPTGRLGIRMRHMYNEARRFLKMVGMEHIDPRTPVYQLSPAEQQMVEIAKVLSLNAKLIIFDEPTGALTENEIKALFRVIDTLRAQNCAVIYISHRLEEIFRIAQRVTVLKDGQFQGTFPVAETTPSLLVSHMVGRDIQKFQHSARQEGKVVLEVRHLSDRRLSRDARIRLHDISFQARAGEILVFAGLAGAGRTELALTIFGARPFGEGEVYVDDKRIYIRSPRDAIAAGIGYLSEDRKESGLFLTMNIAENVAVTRLEQFGSWRLNDRKRDQIVEGYRQKLSIATPNVRKMVQQLSGGNQQKVSLAKWLLLNPKVLIVDEPTRGIDVGAKSEVHQLLYQLAREENKAIIVISSELPEVLAVADRILVIAEGRIAGELNRETATEEAILRLASIQTGNVASR